MPVAAREPTPEKAACDEGGVWANHDVNARDTRVPPRPVSRRGLCQTLSTMTVPPGSGVPPGYPPVWHAPPGYAPSWWMPQWKGAALGRPPQGPGALAQPGLRLGARLLDALIFLPFTIVVATVAIVIAAPHVGPLFPNNANGTSNTFPGFLWLELVFIATALLSEMVWVFFAAFCTARWGRTPGKAVVHIRPLKSDGRPVGFGLALGREASTAAAGILSWIGLLDPLWCLWDDNRQCVHDKIASTIVIQD